ncbi:MAG: lysophospholipid acyltransferase family protein [Woeseia sp.]
MWKRIAFAILRLRGWTLVGEVPTVKKAVLIAAPHTSNWDGFWLIVCKVALDLKLRFFAKHTLFWWPLGTLLTALGAIPVEKSRNGANVDKLVRLFNESDQLFLALAPEGTRKWRPYWRSGFYRIAKAANVPIILTFIDYESKRAGIGPQIDSSGSADETMAQIRAFYASCTAAKPENMGPVMLKEQDSGAARD